jgi:hypothetical protein
MNQGRTVRKRTGKMSSVTNKKIFKISAFWWGIYPRIWWNLVPADLGQWGIAGSIDGRG